MNLYRHKENRKLYTIEHIILDIHHLNNNEFTGIYAYPFDSNGEIIVFKGKNTDDCETFVKHNFDIVSTN